MDERIKKYAFDIFEAIEHTEEFTKETDSFAEYEKNLLVRRGVERELEIIGEAMNRILKIDENIDITNARRIVDMRNRVIHGYDKVDNAVIWGILKRHLPNLKIEIVEFLKE